MGLRKLMISRYYSWLISRDAEKKNIWRTGPKPQLTAYGTSKNRTEPKPQLVAYGTSKKKKKERSRNLNSLPTARAKTERSRNLNSLPTGTSKKKKKNGGETSTHCLRYEQKQNGAETSTRCLPARVTSGRRHRRKTEKENFLFLAPLILFTLTSAFMSNVNRPLTNLN